MNRKERRLAARQPTRSPRTEREIVQGILSRIEASCLDYGAWRELDAQLGVMYRARKQGPHQELQVVGSMWRAVKDALKHDPEHRLAA